MPKDIVTRLERMLENVGCTTLWLREASDQSDELESSIDFLIRHISNREMVREEVEVLKEKNMDEDQVSGHRDDLVKLMEDMLDG